MQILRRFLLIYVLLYGLSFLCLLPIYSERTIVAMANGLLGGSGGPGVDRRISLVVTAPPRDGLSVGRRISMIESVRWFYLLEVNAARRWAVDIAPVHPHGYSLVLVIAFAFALPGIGRPERAMLLTAGVLVCLALGVVLLLGDVWLWERQHHALELTKAPTVIPPRIGEAITAFHHTRAPEVLPLVLQGMIALGFSRAVRGSGGVGSGRHVLVSGA